MTTAEKITPLDATSSQGVLHTGDSKDQSLSQLELVTMIATALALVNYITTEHEVNLTKNQGKTNTALQKSTEEINTENAQKLQDYENQLNASQHLSWWQQLLGDIMKVFQEGPIMALIGIIRPDLDMDKVLNDKIDQGLKDLFSKIDPNSPLGGFLKGLIGLVVLVTSIIGIGSEQDVLTAGIDPSSDEYKALSITGAVLGFVAQIAITIVLCVVTGGADLPMLVTRLLQIVSILTTILNVASSGLGIGQGTIDLQMANDKKELVNGQSSLSFLNAIVQVVDGVLKETSERMKGLLESITREQRDVLRLTDPMAVLAAQMR